MAFTSLVCAPPHATAYDEAYPTRSTENYAHALHIILEDMKDAGWSIDDGEWSNSHANTFAALMRTNIKTVFDYAKQAITNHRASTPTGLSEPVYSDVYWSSATQTYKFFKKALYNNAHECIAMMYKIYYMWETEEDPLLIKEKLQELLIAWPLTDTEIILNEEGGSKIRVVPAWKDVDI